MEMSESQKLYSLLDQLSLLNKNGIAVAVNSKVVPKNKWSEYLINENDEVIIIEAAQGG